MTDSNDTRPISHVFRWDLDKTYLQTEFDKVADLIRTALQKPEEKRNVPGAVALLRALLREPLDGSRRAVYFISGSPRQMRKTLERKLELDGIHPDAFVLKPNLQNLLLFRFKAIRGQVGYKLRALLEHQAPGSAAAPETLFGDDAEQDAFIYSIYGEIVSGRLPLEKLEELLEVGNVYEGNRDVILEAARDIPKVERVQRVFIILDRKTPPARFRPYMPRLVPVYNYFQAALVLFQDGLLDRDDIVDISLDMIERDDYNPFALTNSMQDIIRRGHLRYETAQEIGQLAQVDDRELGEVADRFLQEVANRVEAMRGVEIVPAAPPEQAIDWVALLREELAAPKRHKVAQKRKPVSDTQLG